MLELIWLIPILPLLGFLINALLARKFQFPEKLVGSIAVATVFLAFVLSVFSVFSYSSWSTQNNNQPYIAKSTSYTWISGGKATISEGKHKAEHQLKDFQIEWSYQIDHLSGLYILFVTFVGLLIHIFAIGYMHGQKGFARFFAYLNLFMFMMLTLVLGSNLLMLFVGWEGVGLCSYLLIGFYMNRQDAALASKKAFIFNRIGDLGLLLAIFALFATFGTLQYGEIAKLVQEYPVETLGSFGLMSAIALGLFIGATGKSAQIPLFVWLPDAMAGPTPVSALIHAATMVTAGVYLLARMNMVFQRSLTMMFIVSLIGVLTAFIAATIALTQKDIKKVLAYSTISQLGYMFLGCGVGAFVAAVFHVVTHAFFKSQLFLGAGSVIHAMKDEQDITKMGGLKKYIPTTYKTMLVAWLAICGIAPFSGFWSKDEILAKTFSTTLFNPFIGKTLWFLAFLTAGITAFYMTRFMALIFWSEQKFLNPTANDGGEEINEEPKKPSQETFSIIEKTQKTESTEEKTDNASGFRVRSVSNTEASSAIIETTSQTPSAITPKESSSIMTIPLIILAALSAVGGFIGLPFGYNAIEHWLSPIMDKISEANIHGFGATETILAVVSMLWSLSMVMAAYHIYVKNPQLADSLADKLKPLYQISVKKWYWDDLLDKATDLMKKGTEFLQEAEQHILDNIPNGSALITRGSSILFGATDRYGVDLLVNLVGWFTRASSIPIRTFQTGFLNNYALAMIVGVILIIVGVEYDAIKELYAHFFPTPPQVPPPGTQ